MQTLVGERCFAFECAESALALSLYQSSRMYAVARVILSLLLFVCAESALAFALVRVCKSSGMYALARVMLSLLLLHISFSFVAKPQTFFHDGHASSEAEGGSP